MTAAIRSLPEVVIVGGVLRSCICSGCGQRLALRRAPQKGPGRPRTMSARHTVRCDEPACPLSGESFVNGPHLQSYFQPVRYRVHLEHLGLDMSGPLMTAAEVRDWAAVWGTGPDGQPIYTTEEVLP